MDQTQSIFEKYPKGSRPRIHYIPFLIFISYIVSLIGAFTTVELLHRRESTRNTWRSWVQLGACSVSFGLVAIWCMHFVGNRAIVLGDGEKEIQLYYDATFTSVSAVLPIIVIFLGLLVADRFYKNNRRSATRHVALLVCGVCAGAAVTEMHYLGNNGTTNYRLKPSLQFIIGAASIAVIDCIVAFGLFFHWSGHWVNNIWRRLLVACFLAVAVSGMHWTAAAGTAYELTGYHAGSGHGRNVNLIIAVSLTFDDDFDIRHPVFQWLFRVSRNWNGIIDLIPSMRDHLQHTGYLQTATPVMGGASRVSLEDEEDTNNSYSAIFREMFCITAQDIARSMDTRLQDLGHLYENVETTGTLLNARTLFLNAQGKNILAANVAEQMDLEAGVANPILFGRGQLLVLTRKVEAADASRLQNIGFRFASIEQIGDQLARSLQISREDLTRLIGRLQLSCAREPLIPRKGTYLASFLLQPSPVMQGLDVIVQKATPDRLPMVQLSEEELSQRQVRLLSALNGSTLEDCLMRIERRFGSVTEDDIFLDKVRNRILELVSLVPEPALYQAYFSGQQLDVAHGMSGQNDPLQGTIFAFCGIKEVYNQSIQSPTLQCVPLSFFRANLRSYPGSPDHGILAHKNHKEFGSLHASTLEATASTSRKARGLSKMFRKHAEVSSSSTSINPDSSSEKGLVDVSSSTADGSAPSHPFGGIMISKDIVISEDQQDNSPMEMKDLGSRCEAGVADTEQLTVADHLMAITTSFRDPHGGKVLVREGRR
ncbi:hypothetical protein CC80DRAFT_582781 [Byssothecium circinans]|uniref:MHYT domain-containing protein n=1 Tax=Byssothecium circinans TaxID=147558 RepID=A0A6A5U8W8_9PLEO|nr:hypothetical protein CC80DRAFT_582781 [Byssothecium circinans]